MWRLFGTKKHPKVISFRRAQDHVLDFSSIRLHFKAPPYHRPDISYEPHLQNRYNLYDPALYQPDERFKEPPYRHFCFGNIWVCYGPPFQRYKGWLHMSITLHQYVEHPSLFNPAMFEATVDTYLDHRWSPKTCKVYESGDRIEGRYHWGASRINGADWVQFDTVSVIDSRTRNLYRCYATPLSETHFVVVTFDKYQTWLAYDVNAAFDPLIGDIMQSMQIDWSEEALREQQVAKEKWPEVKYQKTRSDLIWTQDMYPYQTFQEEDYKEGIDSTGAMEYARKNKLPYPPNRRMPVIKRQGLKRRTKGRRDRKKGMWRLFGTKKHPKVISFRRALDYTLEFSSQERTQ